MGKVPCINTHERLTLLTKIHMSSFHSLVKTKMLFITLPLVIYLQLILRNFSVNASSSSEVEDTTLAGLILLAVDEGGASFGWTASGVLNKTK